MCICIHINLLWHIIWYNLHNSWHANMHTYKHIDEYKKTQQQLKIVGVHQKSQFKHTKIQKYKLIHLWSFSTLSVGVEFPPNPVTRCWLYTLTPLPINTSCMFACLWDLILSSSNWAYPFHQLVYFALSLFYSRWNESSTNLSFKYDKHGLICIKSRMQLPFEMRYIWGYIYVYMRWHRQPYRYTFPISKNYWQIIRHSIITVI